MNRITRFLCTVAASTLLAALPSFAMCQSISHISFANVDVTGGQSTTGLVTLNGKAPNGGITLTLASNQTYAQVPTSVTVSSGSRSALFKVTTSGVAARSSATIIGTDPGKKTASDTIRILPAALANISLNPQSVVGGNSSTATLTLNGDAPTGGLAVSILSNLADVQVPSSVVVASGATTATFTVTTSAVTSNVNAVIVATDANGRHALSVLRITAPVVVDIRGIAVDVSRVIGGGTATGVVALNATAPTGGYIVTLASSASFAQVPASITVPAGSKQVTFKIATSVVTTSGTATITGTDPNNKTAKTTLDVVPLGLVAVAVAPNSIKGGDGATGIVLLDAAAPTGGLVINLASNQSSLQVPSSVTVPAGSLSASFTVKTSKVASKTKVTISATDPNGKTVTTAVIVH